MKYRIGVISDTHGLLRAEVEMNLQGCDMILHAGDINSKVILEELGRIAPTFPVRGNADKDWADEIPATRVVEVNGIRIFMIHNKKQIQEDVAVYNLVIYGHSHKYEEKEAGETKWLNPGSCGPRRFHLAITMAMLTVEEDGTFHIERIDIPHQAAQTESDSEGSIPAELVKAHIPEIMREIDEGMPIEKIAKKYKLSEELVEQICRLYLTHPGVDADGIMAKMGL